MKIKSVRQNNHRKAFEVVTRNGKQFWFPYAKLDIQPSAKSKISEVYVDSDLGYEAFTVKFETGEEDTVHIDHVLDYNRDPGYEKELLLYELTLAAQKLVKESPLSKRELARRLGTSDAQLYRLLDQTNTRKSIDKMVMLLSILDCKVELNLQQN